MKDGGLVYAVVAHREAKREIEDLLAERLALAIHNIDYSFSK
jgi:hypothetical protein